MIPIVENVLSEIIMTRLKFIKSKPDIVDRIFSQSTVTMRTRLKEYITGGSLKVVRGFPNDRANLPCYSIMLGGEREQEKALGGVMSDDFDDVSIESSTETQVLTRENGRLVFTVAHKPIELVNFVTRDGLPLPFEVINAKRGIVSVIESEDVILGDSVLISYAYPETGYDSFGSLFNSQYRIETWTNNGDLTVMLYHLLKWILMSSRDLMEEKGLAVQTLGGLDFEPAPEYFPELVYRRALTFECIIENSYDSEFGFIQGFDVTGEIGEREWNDET